MSVIVNHDGVAMDRPVVCGHCPVTTVSRGGRILRQYILDYWLDGRFLSVYVYAESWCTQNLGKKPSVMSLHYASPKLKANSGGLSR